MSISSDHAVHFFGHGQHDFVLAHGIGGDQTQWAPIISMLQRRGRVVTFDLAGSGECAPSSFSMSRHSSIAGFADDLALICADIGVRGATFVGHSMSGMSGALAAAADPGLFSRLVLVGASARYVDDEASGYHGGFSAEAVDALLRAAAGDFTLMSAGFAPHLMGNSDRPELATEFMASLRRYDPSVAVTVLKAAFQSDFREFMPLVSVPTLIMQTQADPAVPPEAADWLAAAIPRATLRTIQACGHFPHVSSPQLVAAGILEFEAAFA